MALSDYFVITICTIVDGLGLSILLVPGLIVLWSEDYSNYFHM